MLNNVALGCVFFRYIFTRTALSGSFPRSTLRHNQFLPFLKRRIQHTRRAESVSIVCGNNRNTLDSAGDQVGYGSIGALLETPGPRTVEFRPFGRRQYSAFSHLETRWSVLTTKNSINVLKREFRYVETLELGTIPFGI